MQGANMKKINLFLE